MDSIRLMSATRRMQDASGVEWAAAVMATPAILEELAERGFAPGDLDGASADDLLLVVEAHTDGVARAALTAAEEALDAEAAAAASSGWAAERRPRTLREALTALPGANLALISVPGPYAALEASKALSAGLHVLLFSDNVPLEAEVELKARAAKLGLLVMGPGAGTALLGRTGLGFANVVTRGRVGIVAAAGTGAQEVMCLLDRWGAGISHVIGVGGRDLSIEVGGRMASLGLGALNDDEDTKPWSSSPSRRRRRWPGQCWWNDGATSLSWLPSSGSAERLWTPGSRRSAMSVPAAASRAQPCPPSGSLDCPSHSSVGGLPPAPPRPCPASAAIAEQFEACSAAALSAGRRCFFCIRISVLCTRTCLCAQTGACLHPRARMSCWTLAKRSSHGAAPTR